MLRLSNTYFLLFALKNDPKVVEYFNGLSQHLILYVGSDLVIKALSEYHVPPEGRLVTNTLSVIRESGATLILGEPAFDEVYSHLRAADLEFINYYAPIEPSIDADFVPYIDRILIRSYFYARFGLNTHGHRPKGWRSYIGQFCSYEGLRGGKSKDSLRMYLCDKFGFTYETITDMKSGIEREELKNLTESILSERHESRKLRSNLLAYNDALHALRVYSKRRELREDNVPNPFGYKTWWLTHERAVQRAAAKLFKGRRSRFIIKPEFLLNYIALSPSKRDVAASYREIFPTVLGVSLSKRMEPTMLREVLVSAREAYEVDESRARAKIVEFTNQLKADQFRKYEVNFDRGK